MSDDFRKGKRSLNVGKILGWSALFAAVSSVGYCTNNLINQNRSYNDNQLSILADDFPQESHLSVSDFSRIVNPDAHFCMVTTTVESDTRSSLGQQVTLEDARSDVGCYNDTLTFIDRNWHGVESDELRVITDFYTSSNAGSPYRSIECARLNIDEKTVCKDITETPEALAPAELGIDG